MTLQRLLLNSRNRFKGKPECPTFTLNNMGVQCKSFFVSKVEIPHSFYNITSANNILYWTDDTGTSQISTLTVGNYTTSELVNHMSDVMTTDTLADTGTATYTVSANGITKKITITNNLNANFSIEWSSCEILARMLGFSNSPMGSDFGLPNVVDNSGNYIYNANNQYWIGSPKNILIKSSLMNSALVSSIVNTSAHESGSFGIIEQVLVDTVAGEITVYEPSFPVDIPCRDDTISVISFELLDENLNKLDLNGRDWSITIAMRV